MGTPGIKILCLWSNSEESEARNNMNIFICLLFYENKALCWYFKITLPHLFADLIYNLLRLQVSISSTFYARFFCQYVGTKNYKAETFGFVILFQLCNFSSQKFCTKNMRVKCWWNWLLQVLFAAVLLNFLTCASSSKVVGNWTLRSGF